ncbi:MAG: hypothetical protein AB1898_30685 [Acidobacteriota bacterium]
MTIDKATSTILTDTWSRIEAKAQQAKFLEESAQALTAALHSQFEESVVIARVFMTVPFGTLPVANQSFVRTVAASAGADSQMKPNTPVLSLVGTHGQEQEWRDRRKSKGHAGIPLMSASFVGAIPMISRLLRELGVPLAWVDSHDAKTLVQTIGSAAGLFFVEDASKATDDQGRKIIAAQDFVSKYQVKSVFGVGGAYSGGEILVIVLFCRDVVTRATAERFLGLTELFKSKTAQLVESQKIFSS